VIQLEKLFQREKSQKVNTAKSQKSKNSKIESSKNRFDPRGGNRKTAAAGSGPGSCCSSHVFAKS
jgi:hypothetical protein